MPIEPASDVEVPRCCGLPPDDAPPQVAVNGSPAAAMWDKMLAWYSRYMSPGTSELRFAVAVKLKLSPEADHPGLDVVETHCGDAPGTEKFLSDASKVRSYTLCDFSSVMLGGAKANLSKTQTAVEPKFVVADSCKLPFPDGAFDRYLANMSCCCVQDVDAMLKEARRSLRPGGLAGCSMRCQTAGDSGFIAVAKALEPFGFPSPPLREGVVLGTDEDKLRAKLSACGFDGDSAEIWRDFVRLPLQSVEEYVEFAKGPMSAAWWEKTFGAEAPGDEAEKKANEEAAMRAIEECAKAAIASGGAKTPVAAFVAKAA
eukprot:TRINITY_DN24313_c0_g1_i3.p1 TRINITY_DN24313_c0_g1~~TRINITY_DN24313_c0_g1_i3.p1  ORF type:complete len:315 (-),score=66.08 TRINITY_DN24313_c0_g1_i3:237-1181(-)